MNKEKKGFAGISSEKFDFKKKIIFLQLLLLEYALKILSQKLKGIIVQQNGFI
jgi:hypothetical protein